MWNRLQRYRALDPEARKYFRKAARLIPWIALSLRVRGFNKTKSRLLAGLPQSVSSQSHPPTPEDTVETICRMVKAASRYGVLRASCLEESLALCRLLREQSVPASLRIGVRKASDKFEAHAWVECDGVALNQADELHRHYAAFDRELSRLVGGEP